MSEYTWKQRDGQLIDIRWMTSPHLIHSFNMVLRKQNWNIIDLQRRIALRADDVFYMMHVELERRGLLKYINTEAIVLQLEAEGVKRETPVQMAMLRALLDTDTGGSCTTGYKIFRENPDSFLRGFTDSGWSGMDEVRVKFTEYRLTQGL